MQWPWFRRGVVYESRVLMVCAGNICRSPTAEVVLRKRLEEYGLGKRIGVASAGTFPESGWPADPRSQAAAARRGYDLSKVRARGVVADDFARFDLILGMDEANLERLGELCPADLRFKLGLLLDQGGRPLGEREVPDPYYGGPAGFERVLDLVEPACASLVNGLRQRLP